MRKLFIAVVALMLVGVMVRTGSVRGASGPKPSAASRSGAAVAYAKASIASQTVLSFGGKGTSAAVVSGGDSNSFIDVTFTGKYPKDLTEDQVIINATAQSSDFGVANAVVLSVSSSQLVIEVSGWISDDTTTTPGETVFFSVFLGH